jgi:hypothetical protein
MITTVYNGMIPSENVKLKANAIFKRNRMLNAAT